MSSYIFELLILCLGETCWEAPKDVDTFGSLVSLEDLNLNINSITVLPNSIGKCTRLKVIKAEVRVGVVMLTSHITSPSSIVLLTMSHSLSV